MADENAPLHPYGAPTRGGLTPALLDGNAGLEAEPGPKAIAEGAAPDTENAVQRLMKAASAPQHHDDCGEAPAPGRPAMQSTVTNPRLQAALEHAAKGRKVFPCHPGTKRPATATGFKEATDLPEVITHWWKGNPDFNVAIATGNGLLVLDIDLAPGGEASLAALEAAHGKLPETTEQQSPSGGRHLLFQYPKTLDIRNSASKLGPGLDIRANGGYIMMTPSATEKGIYSWTRRRKAAEAPPWLLDLLIGKSQAKSLNRTPALTASTNATNTVKKAQEALRGAEEGTRNDQLNKIAFALGRKVASGVLDEQHVRGPLLATALEIGLDHDEALATINSGLSAGSQKPLDPEYLGKGFGLGAFLGEKTPHLAVAHRVLEDIGTDNLITTAIGAYVWQEAGVWELVEDRRIQQHIINAMPTEEVTKSSLGSVLELIKTVSHKPSHAFDQGIETINVQNGELAWSKERGWELIHHCREHFRTTQCPVAYDPEASAPRFTQFTEEIFHDDPDKNEKILVAHEMLGYSLMATNRFEKFILLIGGGANGKSVLMALVAMLVGSKNVAAVQPSQFDNKFQRAHLHGKLVNLVTEIAEGAVIDDASLKAIVSGETTTAEHKFMPPFEFAPFVTCWFGTNHRPHTRDFTEGFFRRAIVLEFNRTFKEEEQDKNLKDKLAEELPGILNLALQGIDRVLQQGQFTSPPSVRAAVEAWRTDVDQVAQYAEEFLTKKPGHQEHSVDLYLDFLEWAKLNGHQKTVKRNTFSQRLVRLGATLQRGSKGERMIEGFARPTDASQRRLGK